MHQLDISSHRLDTRQGSCKNFSLSPCRLTHRFPAHCTGRIPLMPRIHRISPRQLSGTIKSLSGVFPAFLSNSYILPFYVFFSTISLHAATAFSVGLFRNSKTIRFFLSKPTASNAFLRWLLNNWQQLKSPPENFSSPP